MMTTISPGDVPDDIPPHEAPESGMESDRIQSLDSDGLQSMLAFAHQLADAAAQVTLRHFRQPVEVDNKLQGNDFDPVTIADKAAEEAMRELIRTQYPAHGIYGEEHGLEAGSSDLTWVLDPIDGTRAFISGLPIWGILIALYDGERPIVGIMDQPFTGERYFACGRGGVSMLRYKGTDTKLATSSCEQLSDAIMMSTAPDMFDSSETNVHQKLAGAVKLMRYGGDCYAYCLLAAGHIDLVIESGLSAYDIQALIPVIENAGGMVTDWSGETAVNGGQIVAAATPAIHHQALEVLAPAAKKSNKIL